MLRASILATLACAATTLVAAEPVVGDANTASALGKLNRIQLRKLLNNMTASTTQASLCESAEENLVQCAKAVADEIDACEEKTSSEWNACKEGLKDAFKNCKSNAKNEWKQCKGAAKTIGKGNSQMNKAALPAHCEQLPKRKEYIKEKCDSALSVEEMCGFSSELEAVKAKCSYASREDAIAEKCKDEIDEVAQACSGSDPGLARGTGLYSTNSSIVAKGLPFLFGPLGICESSVIVTGFSCTLTASKYVPSLLSECKDLVDKLKYLKANPLKFSKGYKKVIKQAHNGIKRCLKSMAKALKTKGPAGKDASLSCKKLSKEVTRCF